MAPSHTEIFLNKKKIMKYPLFQYSNFIQYIVGEIYQL